MSSLLIADTTFENIVQELPAGIAEMAREFRAFARSRIVRSPEELLRAVLLYCGLDYTLREVAANFTQVGQRLTDEGVRGRLSGCVPWLEAMLREMLPKPDAGIVRFLCRLILTDTGGRNLHSGSGSNVVRLQASFGVGLDDAESSFHGDHG